MNTPKLTPKTVQIGSELKFFGLDRGASDGSSVSITFDIPEGVDDKEMRKLILTEKEKLDKLVLYCEQIKGSVDESVFKQRKAAITTAYDKLLGRTKAE